MRRPKDIPAVPSQCPGEVSHFIPDLFRNLLAEHYPASGDFPRPSKWLGYGVFRGWLGYRAVAPKRLVKELDASPSKARP